MSAPRVGLALGSGGGARGWCHIGVLRALDELGVRPSMVAGCSMGSLVGVAWAADRLDALEDWVRSLTPPGRFLGLIDIRPLSGGLVEAGEIEVLLRDLGIPDRIEDLPCPFAAVATDMETGREVWLRDGPTYASVRASVGIPGVMSRCNWTDAGCWMVVGEPGARFDRPRDGGGRGHHCRQSQRQAARAHLAGARAGANGGGLGGLEAAARMARGGVGGA